MPRATPYSVRADACKSTMRDRGDLNLLFSGFSGWVTTSVSGLLVLASGFSGPHPLTTVRRAKDSISLKIYPCVAASLNRGR